MRTRGRIRWGRLAMLIAMFIGSALIVIAMAYICIIHVVNRSFTYNPPTPEEISEDPSLVRFLK